MNIIKSYIFYKVVTTTSVCIQSIQAGTNITIDDTDPLNPIISASGGGGGITSVNGDTGPVVLLDASDVGADVAGSAAAAQAASQPLDTDLTAISNLTPSDGDFLYREGGTWVNKNNAQVRDLLGVYKRVFVNTVLVNNNAVANTLQDATGYSFPVVAGNRYWFRFWIKYDSAATTTGSRWTINGPTFSDLSIISASTLAATTRNFNTVYAYDSPSGASTASLTTNNIAEVYGNITVTADGTIQLRFASEVSASAITIQSGGFLEYGLLI